MNPIERVRRSLTMSTRRRRPSHAWRGVRPALAACASVLVVSVCTLEAQTIARADTGSSTPVVAATPPHDNADASIRPYRIEIPAFRPLRPLASAAR